MKNIEISEKQKEMLLEMCKVLFPKIDWKWWIIEGPNGEMEELELLEYSTKEQFLTIHWFEFCITHLAEKLMGQYNLIRALNEEELDKHPIDYLYEEFKKLK